MYVPTSGSGIKATTIGTFLRYLIIKAFYDPIFPFGTLIANWTGCLDLAWLNEQWKYPLSPVLRKGLGTGLLGSYTTFSTFCVETHKLWQQKHKTKSWAYLLSSLFFGLLLVWAGFHFSSGIDS